MLTSARRHYVQQQRVTALAVREARRRAGSGILTVARGVAAYQLASVELALASAVEELSEQGIAAPPVARVNAGALLTDGAAMTSMLERAATAQAFDRLVASLVQDAASTATTVDMARRPALTGHVRTLNLPSCSRCAVLAGRVYAHSEAFQRHPQCDCIMTPTTLADGLDHLTIDGAAAAKAGQVHGLSRADMEALDAGADLGQVVNTRRKAAGLRDGSSVIERAGRLTPAGVMRVASSRDEAIDLMRRFGYLR